MKIGGLYLRMLATFILVQLLAMLTMFALVHMDKFRPPFARHAEERAVAIKNLVEREIAEADKTSPKLKYQLDSMLQIFSSAFQGEAWITDSNGNIISSSFGTNIPLTGNEKIDLEQATADGDTLYLIKRDDHQNIYTVGTLLSASGPLSIHLLHKWRKRKEEIWLMEGLLLMSSIAALLLIPGSRRITRPINQLTESARQMARGDFSPRVNVKWTGEVSILAKAFNHMAESLERLVRGGRELTANLSHELRSPLARIRISQQIIQERMESGRSDGVKKHVQKMKIEIDHMNGLIDKILKLSKLDLQETQTRNNTVDINKLLNKAVTRHTPLMAEKSITLEQIISPVPTYRCHEENMRIVLDNVLINAIKYSPGNNTITLTSQAKDDTLTIEVTNPYRSLSKDELESIFIPFKRLGYDPVEGSGLGLAFAKKLVEDHDGTMAATSTPDNFTMAIRLPLG